MASKRFAHNAVVVMSGGCCHSLGRRRAEIGGELSGCVAIAQSCRQLCLPFSPVGQFHPSSAFHRPFEEPLSWVVEAFVRAQVYCIFRYKAIQTEASTLHAALVSFLEWI